ncbi:MAG: hypothetical protein PHX87_04055 [Candidatus Peribacteraceae bacterium]|nr:hypothetical protein [Candidatus Peribacteraceae bacterium]MDD5742577.1 hypothetical protein [Candidatus Peribacteraceae bacterium]
MLNDLERNIAQLGVDSLRQITALLCIKYIVEEYGKKLRAATESNDMTKVRECINEFTGKLQAQLSQSGIPMDPAGAEE